MSRVDQTNKEIKGEGKGKGIGLAAKAKAKEIEKVEKVGKTLCTSEADPAKQLVKDIKFWGQGDMFKLLSKASSAAEGWMKSTKAMEIEGMGCLVQVSTQQGDHVAEALEFVPGVKIETLYEEGEPEAMAPAVIRGRRLVPIGYEANDYGVKRGM